MTSTTTDLGATSGLRIAWLGHAVGARADGLTSYSSEVVEGLVGSGAEVWFHHANRDGAGVPVDAAHRVGWPTWRFKTVTVAGPGFRGRMREWLRRTRPDLVHTSLSFTLADGWVAKMARAEGMATVATFHLPFGRAGSGRARVMRQLHRFWAPRLRHYQRVIVFSPEHRLGLAEVGVDPGRILVLPNAVDTRRFSPGPSSLRRTRLQGAGLVVGYAGRMDPEKGLSELIEGFESARLGSGARLVLAGDGSLQGQAVRAQRDPRVIYLGQLLTAAERVDFWRALDLFCLPSSAEGLSISLLEAMATGVAVAATPAGGAAAVGEGVAGLDPGALSGSIRAVLEGIGSDPGELERRGRLARTEAVRHHEMSAMLARLLTIYRECLAERP